MQLKLSRHLAVQSQPGRVGSLLWDTQAFEVFFHTQSGHKNITVTDWIDVPQNGTKQRVCFFAMEDPGAENSDLNQTKCIETQTLHNVDGKVSLSTHIVPETNDVGTLFRLQVRFSIDLPPQGGCTIVVVIDVDSKVKGMILGSVVNRILQDKISKIYTVWLDSAEAFVKRSPAVDSPPVSPEPEASEDSIGEFNGASERKRTRRPNNYSKPRNKPRSSVRQQSVPNLGPIAPGTENVVKLLRSHDESSQQEKQLLLGSFSATQKEKDNGYNLTDRSSLDEEAGLNFKSSSASSSARRARNSPANLRVLIIIAAGFLMLLLLASLRFALGKG